MFSLLKGQNDQKESLVDGHFACLVNEIFYGQIHHTDIVGKCKDLGSVELFSICDAINGELLHLCLENSVLEDFLKQNDPKMLIGLTEEDLLSDLTKASMLPDETVKIKFEGGLVDNTKKISRNIDSASMGSSNMSLMKRSLGQSIANTTTTLERKTREYRLNYKTKAELTNKAIIELKTKIRGQERNAYNDFKRMEAIIEETKYQLLEADGTLQSFNVNIVTLGSDPITGIISSEKFVKFCQQFLNTGMTTCSKMRIISNNLEQEISFMRNVIVAKQEKSGVVTNADFETLVIKKAMSNRVFKDKINNLDFLKGFKGKVSYSLSFTQKDVVETDEQLKVLEKKIADIKKITLRIEKDSIIVLEERDAAIENLRKLNEQVANYSAPKAVEYISLKDKLSGLEKERKKLKQQIYLLSIRLKNAVQKTKISK